MKGKSQVSVILISYNHEKYFLEAIDSGLNQTFTDFVQSNRTRFKWLNVFFNHGNAPCHPSVGTSKSCAMRCAAELGGDIKRYMHE